MNVILNQQSTRGSVWWAVNSNNELEHFSRTLQDSWRVAKGFGGGIAIRCFCKQDALLIQLGIVKSKSDLQNRCNWGKDARDYMTAW